jgi:tRNA (guanine10-N2)-dimethyltransferase
MKLLFELSKEYDTIPKSEIISCLKGENLTFNIDHSDNDVLIVKSDISKNQINILSQRLSFSFSINKLLFSSSNSIEDIKEYAQDVIIESNGSIAINYKNRSKSIDSKPILELIGDLFTKNKIVNLEDPELIIRVIITDDFTHVGLNVAEINRSEFEKRKVQNRPFFSPISLHPKLARALVNFSQIKRGDTLIDPFCGTGGILIEAGLIGIKLIGCDIEDKMIEGCNKTLNYYNINKVKLIKTDIGDIENYVTEVDSIVTDLPYGRATTTKGEDIESLYNRAFLNFSKILKKDHIAVIVSPNKDLYSIGKKYFSLIDHHEIKVHRSLTRHIGIFKR